MRRALTLAERGSGQVSPNPMVGCVIVKNGRIVGEGFHKRYGGPHAESGAFKQAGPKAHNASLYINLEPCTHWGNTPPCAPQVAQSGIKEAYISIKDPDPRVAGRGIQLLKKSGIKVRVGLESDLSKHLNRAFLTRINKNRPYTIIKMAMSLDGKIASYTGDSKWLTSSLSRSWVHQLRSQSDAILVGVNTIVQDNPHLTAHGKGKNPLRIVLDPTLRSPKSSRIFTDSKAATWVISGTKIDKNKAVYLQKQGIKNLRLGLRYGKFDLIKIVKFLSKNLVNQLVIEGGGESSWEFIKNKLVDEILIFIAPRIVGGQNAKTPVEGRGFQSIRRALQIPHLEVRRMGPDILLRGRFNN